MYSSCIINLSLHFRFLGKHLRMGRHSQKDGTDGKFMTSNANTIFRLIRMLSNYIYPRVDNTRILHYRRTISARRAWGGGGDTIIVPLSQINESTTYVVGRPSAFPAEPWWPIRTRPWAAVDSMHLCLYQCQVGGPPGRGKAIIDQYFNNTYYLLAPTHLTPCERWDGR
jgi:hypothetical protein